LEYLETLHLGSIISIRYFRFALTEAVGLLGLMYGFSNPISIVFTFCGNSLEI